MYAGGVIAYAKDGDATRAKKSAREAGVTKANELVRRYRARKCPNACKPETIVTREVDDDDVGTILTKRVSQATNEPYVSYAVVYWMVTISCPPAGGGGGGGGIYDDRRHDSADAR